MRRTTPRILLLAVVLVLPSCGTIGVTPVTLSKPTPLSPGSQPFDEAVAAKDDISVARFIANELRLAELETPYSPFEICYEAATQTVKTDGKGKITPQWMKECGSPEDGDFAMSSTVILTSSARSAMCGYLFRSNEKGDWYELRLERSGDTSRWSLVRIADGVVAEVIAEPAAEDHLDLSSGAQTRVLLYARGDLIKVYFNGYFVKMMEDTDLTAGRLGLFAESDSGSAVCQYDSYWVNIYH